MEWRLQDVLITILARGSMEEVSKGSALLYQGPPKRQVQPAERDEGAEGLAGAKITQVT